MNIEDLVPPLELCKKIPEGAFADSALVWTLPFGSNEAIVETRAAADEFAWGRVVNAPTLAEILSETAKFGKMATADCFISMIDGKPTFTADCHTRYYTKIGKNAAEEALKVWFDVRKYEVKSEP